MSGKFAVSKSLGPETVAPFASLRRAPLKESVRIGGNTPFFSTRSGKWNRYPSKAAATKGAPMKAKALCRVLAAVLGVAIYGGRLTAQGPPPPPPRTGPRNIVTKSRLH